MKRKNILILLLLLVIPFVNTFSTPQVFDRLIYKGDTLFLSSVPLESLLMQYPTRPNLFEDKDVCESTGCWRGYIAQWEIIGNQLYLTELYSCCYYKDSIKADLKSLFETRYVDGKVKADWVTDNLIAPKGKIIRDFYNDYGLFYEKEIEFRINAGEVLEIIIHDNSKTRESIYSFDADLLKHFIYSNIKWDNLPALKDDEKIRVLVSFAANEEGVIDYARVILGYNDIFDNEAIRVIKSIPEWNIYYRCGKHEPLLSTMSIIFSEELRNKYSKKQE